MEEQQFDIHPSTELVNTFHSKPYQGQQPELAKIIFISSDANYSPQLSRHPFFQKIIDYHHDPIRFWKREGVHHPFLHKDYPFDRRKDGVPFHRKFGAMGLGSEYAERICFIELLDIPTIGRKSHARSHYRRLANTEHMSYLRTLMTLGQSRVFFVSSTVLNDLKILDGKNWEELNLWRKKALREDYDIPLVYQKGDTLVYRVTHFSGSISTEEIMAIRQLIIELSD